MILTPGFDIKTIESIETESDNNNNSESYNGVIEFDKT